MATRRDRLGRRIGRNWWREWNTELLRDATHMWERQRDTECIGYETEEADYERDHPRPNLRQFLLANKGQTYVR